MKISISTFHNVFRSFKTEFKEGINSNNYKLTADKIITCLKTIKNDPNISSRRWIWELIQNATDVRNENEKISIQIILNEDKLEFKHNGKYFTVNNILGLLQQVSSKNSQNLEGQTGKFGTGLIGTHLLSDIITVQGILEKEKDKFCEFNIILDRSEKTPEKLVDNIQNSIEKFNNIDNPNEFKPRPNYKQNRKESDFDTSFIYNLSDDEKKKAAKDGISDLINTLPTTLITQHKKIKQIIIIDNIKHNETTYIPIINIEEKKNDITESSVKIINKENEETKEKIMEFLSYLKVDNNNNEILRLITQIERKENNIIKLLERSKSKPILYRNFPLIGSNEFNMPFIIDGFNFNPLESRSGLFLNGFNNNSDAQENINILEQAFEASIQFIKCILTSYNVENRYLLAISKKPKPIVNFDTDSDKWFDNKQIYLRENLRDCKIVKHENNYYNLKDLILPVFEEKTNDNFYNIVSNLNIRNKILPDKEDYLNWYKVIIEDNNEIQGLKIKDNPLIKSWGITKNEETGKEEINYIYDEIQLLNDLKNCKNINILSSKIEIVKNKKINKSEIIQYLNELIKFLKNNDKYEQILNEYPIIPNRNGDFKKINELYSDHTNIIPNVIMEIYDNIPEKKNSISEKKKLNEELIDQEINFDILEGILKIKDFDSISKYLNLYILENKNENKDIEETNKYVVYPLLSIKTDDEEITQIYKFLIEFYELEQKSILTDKTKIPIELWTFALQFWYKEHPKEIEKYGNIQELKKKIRNKNKNENELLEWMNDYLYFLKSKSLDRNFENIKIFPNQNGVFCVLNDLKFDTGFPEEFKDILKKYFDIDKKNVLLDKKIVSYNSHQGMPESEIVNEIVSEFDKIKTDINKQETAKNMAFEILCLYPTNEEKKQEREYLEKIIFPPERNPQQLKQNPLDYLGFAEIVYNKKDKFNIKYIETKNLDYITFINYILEQICDEISKYECFENIKNVFYGINEKEKLEDFLIKIIKFFWDNENNKEKPINSYIDVNKSKKKKNIFKYE